MPAFTSAAALGSTILGLSAATVTFTTVAVGFAAQAALGYALYALTPKPKIQDQNRGYTVNSRGSNLDHQVIYGKMRVGGVIVFDGTTGSNNKFFHRVLAVAGHEVESFEEIYINDAKVTQLDPDGNVAQVQLPNGDLSSRYNNVLRLKLKTGTSDQAADTDLVNEVPDWTNEHRLRGIAYIYARFSFNADKYPNGLPTITAVVKGKKVYDPRTQTTVWSDNPALCLRDYLTETGYGLGEEEANIDDSRVIEAANVCEYFNYPTLTGDARYTCNGAFITSVTPYDILNDLLTSMGGLLWYSQGKWRIKPAYWTDPVLDLTLDDFRSSVSVQTRHSRRDNFNVVKGTFRGEVSNWQVTDYPQVTNSVFVAADGGQESVIDLNLPFTSDPDIAQQIALVSLERNRQQLTVSASFGMRAFQVQVGDNIRLTNARFGWANKEFEVVSWTFGLADGGDIQVQMTLRETAESIFDDISNAAIYEADNTTLLSPFDVPPIGVNVSAELFVSNEKVSNLAVATISSGTPESIDYVEVEYRFNRTLVSDPEPDPLPEFSVFGQGPLGKFRVRDLETGIYDFRARPVNTFGVKGDYENLTDVEIDAFIGDPSDVTGFDKELSGGSLFLSWTPLPDADLSHYRIKHNSNTTGATWGNSSTVVERVARPGTSATLPARSGTFLIKAYDKEGNFSENPTTLVIQPSELPQLGQTDTQTEDPTFSGSKTNTAVVSTTLQIDDTTAASPTGEYLFSNYIDTGSARNARVTGFRTFTRAFDGGTLLWDDIPQLWDTWPDNWDTWTNETANFGDVSVAVYVSATDDDPAGSPTWGSYTLANGSFVQGRAFRFKAVFSSTNTNYTPAISALSATVEY